MARIRTIKPALVDSKDVAKVSREARYFFTILLMFLDDKGKCEFMPKRLAGLLFPHDEDVDGKMVSAWTEECVAATLLEKYTVNGKDYLRSPTFWKHQVINRPTPSRYPNPDGTEDSLSKPETLTEGSLRAHGENDESSLSQSGALTEDSMNTHGGLTEDSLRAHGGLIEGSLPWKKEEGSRKKEVGNRELTTTPATATREVEEIPPDLTPIDLRFYRLFGELPATAWNGDNLLPSDVPAACRKLGSKCAGMSVEQLDSMLDHFRAEYDQEISSGKVRASKATQHPWMKTLLAWVENQQAGKRNRTARKASGDRVDEALGLVS
jgi:hypothetical protein